MPPSATSSSWTAAWCSATSRPLASPAAYDLSAVRVLAKRFGLPHEFAHQLTTATGVVIDDQDQAMLDRLYELVGIAAVIVPHVRTPGSSTS